MSLNVVKKVIFDVVKTFGLPIFPCILFLRLLKLTSPCSWSRPCCGLCMCMCVCMRVCGGGSITCVCVCVCVDCKMAMKCACVDSYKNSNNGLGACSSDCIMNAQGQG